MNLPILQHLEYELETGLTQRRLHRRVRYGSNEEEGTQQAIRFKRRQRRSGYN
jgi:hypothetical protein